MEWLRPNEIPQLLHAGIFRLKPGEPFEFELHRHDDFTELLFIRDGYGRFVIGGQEYQVGPRSMLVYNEGVWHEEHSNREQEFDAVYFAFRGVRIGDLPSNHVTGADEPAVVKFHEQFYRVDEHLTRIIREFHSGEPESGSAANYALGSLLVDLVRIMRHSQSRPSLRNAPSTIAVVAKTYIQKNYGKELTLPELADAVYTSPYHLCRLFKKETGRTPIQYLIEYRMDVAKHLLVTTDETLEQIAERIGYASATHFQNVFRKVAGMPPGRFRRLHKGESD